MAMAVKKTISLPPDLAREVEEIAREEGIPVSAVIQDALRLAKRERLKKSFYQAQNYWSRKAKEKGILSERDLKQRFSRCATCGATLPINPRAKLKTI
jgi:predicted transcriptional regulator